MTQFNRVRVLITTGGTGNLTVGAADTGCNPITSYAGATGVPYLLTWTGGYEAGEGSLSGTTFARNVIYENNLGDTTGQSIPTGALLSVAPLAQSGMSQANGTTGTPAPAKATGYDSLAIGMNAVALPVAVAVGIGATADDAGIAIGPNAHSIGGDGGIAIGPQSSAGIASAAIGAAAVTTRGGEIMVGYAGYHQHYQNYRFDTTDATPVVATPDYGDTSPFVIPAGDIWYITATVMAAVFDSGPTEATKAKVITLSVLADHNGPVVTAATPVVVYNFGSLGATATINVTSAGNVEVTVTGVAATLVRWRVGLELKPLTAY